MDKIKRMRKGAKNEIKQQRKQQQQKKKKKRNFTFYYSRCASISLG